MSQGNLKACWFGGENTWGEAVIRAGMNAQDQPYLRYVFRGTPVVGAPRFESLEKPGETKGWVLMMGRDGAGGVGDGWE